MGGIRKINLVELSRKYPQAEVWAHPDEFPDLYDLTLRGTKQATSSWFEEYEKDKVSLPKVGEVSIMLDRMENPSRALVMVTNKVLVRPFHQVTAEEAFLEGEGNRSLRDWQTIFGDYWRKTLPEEGLEFSESGLVVTEIFTVLEDYLLDNEENGRSK
ncbi:ASCH domain-containing protein [Streptococcus anginosus]|uniref:ASCH domain-containing protein n=2 Tax=Streptococcus TaxID=1301 RepID=A0ABD4TZG7_STRAP|nr:MULTISPECIES: ASCH domain-containing protein [Streptococcus]MCW0924842.1 ASCH domain-containing protein [Streptococcus anginosus]MCW1075773.1 ASCH domain-containing protein [Streptococcus anginosus]MDB8655129.1 ASCH domain-containing protein [Streptococcus anginosus]MDB8658638.1 ASCH domain-containing protein [Streptococcus anginosus]VTS30719.1 cytoplasmic protein [Streptococcus anginosus]